MSVDGLLNAKPSARRATVRNATTASTGSIASIAKPRIDASGRRDSDTPMPKFRTTCRTMNSCPMKVSVFWTRLMFEKNRTR